MNVNKIMGNPPLSKVPQLFGVEIEVERGHDSYWVDDSEWMRVEDGSLRDDGMEFITPPVEMDTLSSMVDEYYRQHDDRGYRATIRTGIHVHADMRWRSLEQVSAICTVYALLEPLLFEMCGPDREENIYCVPWYRAPDEADLLRELLDQDEWREVHHRLEGACKYSALYLEPLRRLGTIEFRQAPTFENAAEMKAWAKVVDKLTKLGTYLGTPERVVEYWRKYPVAVLRFVMGNSVDVDRSMLLIEECDSEGVATRLVRTRQKFSWVHQLDEPLDESGVYYRHAGNGERQRPRFSIDENPFEEEYDDDYDEDEEY